MVEIQLAILVRLTPRDGNTNDWYDFTVKAGCSTEEAHYAGRVETGRPSFSDPLMGHVV